MLSVQKCSDVVSEMLFQFWQNKKQSQDKTKQSIDKTLPLKLKSFSILFK